MDDFKQNWHSDDMRVVWEETKSGGVMRGDDSWGVDYQSLARKAQKPEKNTEDVVQPVEENTKELVEEIRDRNRAIRVEILNEETGYPLNVKVAGMSFHIDKETYEVGHRYRVHIKTGSRVAVMQQGILRCLESRKRKESLAHLLVRDGRKALLCCVVLT